MNKFDVIIIGAGLGGLLCGNILSREGFSVCIVEKNPKPGGSLQTFGRKGRVFNTGLNYINSMDEGQILYRYFKYFGLTDKLKLRRLDSNGFEIINFPHGKYLFAMGQQNFLDTLAVQFPAERNSLKTYLGKIKAVSQTSSMFTLDEERSSLDVDYNTAIGAADYIQSVIKDNRLQNILAGNNLLYSGHENKTPLFVHSIVNHSFIESAWRIVDGGHQLVNILVENIVVNGGTLLTSRKADKIICKDKKAVGLQLSTGEYLEGKHFIANIHPVHVTNMVAPGLLRKSYEKRIRNLENTMGIFTLYVVMKKESFPYINANYYCYNQDNSWVTSSYDLKKWPQVFLLMSHASSKQESFSDSFSVLTYMDYNELRKWESTYTGDRGSDYLAFKEEKASVLLDAVNRHFPGFKDHVLATYTSTPLTWRDYTGTIEGSAYGILKDHHRLMETTIIPKTHIANLLLTGQNINLHGAMGVTISAVITCGELIGHQYMLNKIRNEQ